MKKEINDITMKVRPIVMSNVYLNAPSENKLIPNDNLIHVVEYIGKKYRSVHGSDLKNGIFYIKEKTGCSSKRQIKMMLRNVKNACVQYEGDVDYIFRCSVEYYTKVLRFICETEHNIVPSNEATDYLVKDAKIGLKQLTMHGAKESIKIMASNMLSEMEEIDS